MPEYCAQRFPFLSGDSSPDFLVLFGEAAPPPPSGWEWGKAIEVPTHFAKRDASGVHILFPSN